MDSADSGDEDSLRYLRSNLHYIPAHVLEACKRPDATPVAPLAPAACLPGHVKELDIRPRQVVSGTRRVPMLAQANGVPFLRLSHKQPQNLSRILGYLAPKRDQFVATRQEIEEIHIPLGSHEDAWDDIIQNTCGVPQNIGDPSWQQASCDVLKEMNAASYKLMHDRTNMIKRMQWIIDEETKLAEKEKLARERPNLLNRSQAT